LPTEKTNVGLLDSKVGFPGKNFTPKRGFLVQYTTQIDSSGFSGLADREGSAIWSGSGFRVLLKNLKSIRLDKAIRKKS